MTDSTNTKSTENDPIQLVDTVIVGGGIAGLTAAYKIGRPNILVLEKEESVGGRTLSRKMGPFVYNMGAQVILGNHSLVAGLADDLGVTRTLIRKTRIPFYLKDKLVSSKLPIGLILKLPISWKSRLNLALKLFKIKRRYGFMLNETLDPNNPKIIELNTVTLSEFIGQCDRDLTEIRDVHAIGSTSKPANQVAAYYPLNAFLHLLEDEYYVEGGTGNLALALQDRIGGVVKTGADVQEIVREQNNLKVTYLRRGSVTTILAKRCIIAVPAPTALKIIKGLPLWKQEALSNVEFGPGTTAAFAISQPTERFLGRGIFRIPVSGRCFSSITNPTITFSNEAKNKYGGIVRTFILGEQSKKMMASGNDEALDVIVRDLAATFPGIEDNITARAIWHWPLALSVWSPGHMERVRALQAATDNIFYCGDYTISAGMEAAVESAYRVADAINKVGE